MAYEHRWSDVEAWFFEEANKYFTTEEVPLQKMDPVYSHPKIHIFKMINKG
jgi:hypothetical protein